MSAKDFITPSKNLSMDAYLSLIEEKKKKPKSIGYKLFDKVLFHLSGSKAENFISYTNFCTWLHRRVDGAALGVFRVLYGLAMLIDLAEERGGGELDLRYGKPMKCYFPLIPNIRPFELPIMGAIYFCMIIGACGITLGYHFHKSCLLYIVPYWYIFLLDKSTWNNHSYLFGLVGTLLYFTKADCYCCLNRYLDRSDTSSTVPFWNYFLINFQFVVLYVYAGLKKLTPEWLAGYAMSSLSQHWILTPFHWILSYDQIDLFIVHWFTAIFDFSIAFFMICPKTRVFTSPFMILFHLINSRLFVIGMFPWVCLAQTLLFYDYTWPRKCNNWFTKNFNKLKNYNKKQNISNIKKSNKTSKSELYPEKIRNSHKIGLKEKLNTLFILLYCALQLFLPYSHFITKGFNNWTNGIYGYSWDMMVHSYKTYAVQIRIVDNIDRQEYYIEPFAFTKYDRWTKYADMAKQYAKCIYRNLNSLQNQRQLLPFKLINISIYFDVWCSMNSRLIQRTFDPRIDLLTAKWSPFQSTPWLLPLLDEFKHLRPKFLKLSNDVYNWNNATDLIIVADYPGLTLKNMLPLDIINASLSILEGQVIYDEIHSTNCTTALQLTAGQHQLIPLNTLYTIKTIGTSPAIYMITFTNITLLNLNNQILLEEITKSQKIDLVSEFKQRIDNYKKFLKHTLNCLLSIVYGIPFPISYKEGILHKTFSYVNM